MKLTAETLIAGDLEALWQRTHAPAEHVRWDLRFTEIKELPRSDDAPRRFRYTTRIGLGLCIDGWGETVGERDGRASALRFGSDDPKSLIREGSGYWLYQEEAEGIRFGTVYDYEVRHGWIGRVVDRLFFRPLMIWATRWSFDRLRLWIEAGLTPEVTGRLWLAKLSARLALGLVWLLEGLVPKMVVVSPAEVALVRRSGLYGGTPELTLLGLGALEILAALWLLSGYTERLAAWVASLAMLFLTGVVVATDPAALANPMGGLVKNLGLLACAVAVWVLAPLTPSAARASKRPGATP